VGVKNEVFFDREDTLTKNKIKLFGLVLGQCTPALKSTIKSEQDYEQKSAIFDSLWLMLKLKKTTAGVELKANPALSLHEQLMIFFNTRQGINKSDDDYLSRFNSRFKNLEMAGGGHIFCSPDLLKKKLQDANDDEITAETERFNAMCFLLRSDDTRYGELLDDLRRGVHRGRDEYPKTVTSAYELLLHTSRQKGYWRFPRGNRRFNNRNEMEQKDGHFTFTQKGKTTPDVVPGRDGMTHEDIRCYSCQAMRHYSGQCPEQNVCRTMQT